MKILPADMHLASMCLIDYSQIEKILITINRCINADQSLDVRLPPHGDISCSLPSAEDHAKDGGRYI